MASSDNPVNDEPLDEAEKNTPLDKDFLESQSLESTVAKNIFNNCTFNFDNEPSTSTSKFSSQLSIALIVELVIFIPALFFQNMIQDEMSLSGVILDFLLSLLIVFLFIALIVTIVWLIWEKVYNKPKESKKGDKEITRLIDYVRDSIIAEGNTEN